MSPRPADACKRARGFTLIELVVTLAVAGLLLGIASWSMQGFLVSNRVQAAARDLTARVRNAATIAARANRPVELRFVSSGEGCIPRYEIRTTGTGAANYETVCIGAEYPGVAVAAGAMAGKAVKCGSETDLPNCSLCTGVKTIVFDPSGEATTTGTAGDSILFSVRGETSPARTLAVGIRNTSGRARVYRPNAAGDGWECP